MSGRTVALLGAGRMGSAIARRLAANGVQVRVWNRTYSRAAALAGDGISSFESLADAVDGADTVISILSAGPAVREALGAVAEHLEDSTVVVEASTIDAATMAEVAALLPVPVLSAAVSGTPGVVSAGNAGLLVSGDEKARSRSAEVLGLFAARVVPVGSRVEDAKLVKIAINAVLAGTMELLAESTVLLEASGVDRTTFADALGGSVLASTYSTYKLEALVERNYDATFATRDLRKDVALALAQADEGNVELPIAGRVLELLDDAIGRGWGELDFLALVPRLQAASGISPDLPLEEALRS
ncbi:NAD(P)-dependent oxidoreductase [Streptomyces sp. NPDC005708]|uniref:NAD(P)-dependent oxidoreductase n=1 Tax=Streptomyces sp. NPDC005708 TaxID=3154564 RepID=UPI0033DA7320